MHYFAVGMQVSRASMRRSLQGRPIFIDRVYTIERPQSPSGIRTCQKQQRRPIVMCAGIWTSPRSLIHVLVLQAVLSGKPQHRYDYHLFPWQSKRKHASALPNLRPRIDASSPIIARDENRRLSRLSPRIRHLKSLLLVPRPQGILQQGVSEHCQQL
jgi:hypothetical protein